MKAYEPPTRAELDNLLVGLLPPAKETGAVSTDELRIELEERAQRFLSQGVNIPTDLLEMIEALYTILDDSDYYQLTTCAQLERLIERLLPPDGEMDEVSAAIILYRVA